MNHPDEKANPWLNQSLRQRISLCISMLHVRGFLSDTECNKVIKRVLKWTEKFDGKPLPKRTKQ